MSASTSCKVGMRKRVRSRHRRNSTPLEKGRFRTLSRSPIVIRTHTDKGHVHNHIVLNTVNLNRVNGYKNKKSVIKIRETIVTNFVSIWSISH